MTRARLTQATIRRGAVALAAVLLVLSAAFLGYNHHRGSRYAEAVRLAEAGDTTAAYEIFTGLAGYSDAKERAAGLVEKDPALPYRKAAKGDLVTFGSFEQDGDELNGPEPIQWIVLERFGDRLLVLSADVLDGRQYNHVPFQDVTWADSDLRAWMNGDFFDAAFTPAQQGIIPSVLNDNADQSITGAAGGAPTQDRVFALSEQESVIYLSTSAARSDIGAAPASQAAASGTLSGHLPLRRAIRRRRGHPAPQRRERRRALRGAPGPVDRLRRGRRRRAMTRAFALRLVPLKSLRAHPVRAAIILILALAQAACVFGGLVALDGMRAELSLAQRRLGADLVVYPTSCLNKVDKKSVTMLGTPALCDQPRAALSRMGANEDIAAVSYQLTIADQTHGDDPLWVVGYDPATDFVISPWIAEGEGVSPQVGTVAVGSAVPLTDAGDVTIFGRQWPVGAHLEATGTSLDAAVFVSMDTLSQVIAASTQAGVDTYASLNPAEDYTVALVRVANPADVQAVTEWINLYVRKVSAVRSDLTVATTASDIRAHRAVVLGVLGAAWLVLLAALMLAQLTLMNERRHEIYVWRSIGASRRVIARVLTAESLLVHVVGALAGVLVGACVLPLVGDAPALAALASPGRSLPLAALTVALLVGAGVVGTRLALARVARGAQGNKLAPI